MVEEAVVLKIVVVVALAPEKFCKVEEAFTRRLPKVARPVIEAEFTVRRPLELIEKAEMEEVAVPATVVVAKYKFPPAFLKAH